jgi:hypothetical protein
MRDRVWFDRDLVGVEAAGDVPLADSDGAMNVVTYRCQVRSLLCTPMLVASGIVCTRDSR